MYSKYVTSLDGLDSAAKLLVESFPSQRVFAFYGNMGAGKTTFIQAICKFLKSDDYVTSPTFAIINEYTSKNSIPIFHFDFYRINDIEEAFDIGYEDYLYSGNYCLIEWPEKVEQILPGNIVRVKITVADDDSRKIEASIV